MEDVLSLNKAHKDICKNMINYIEMQTYKATDCMNEDKYLDYQQIKEAIVITYNNAFKQIDKGTFSTDEVVYMLPNLLLFSFAGFLAGLINKDNQDEMQVINDETAQQYAEYVSELTDLLDEICSKQK